MLQGAPGGHSPAIRVLIANVSTALEEWLAREVQNEEDIKIVASVQGYVETLLAVQMGVDVVVLSTQDFRRDPGICSHLLGEYPNVKIVLISPAGDKAMLYWMGPRRKALNLASPEELVGTLRQLDMITNRV